MGQTLLFILAGFGASQAVQIAYQYCNQSTPATAYIELQTSHDYDHFSQKDKKELNQILRKI